MTRKVARSAWVGMAALGCAAAVDGCYLAHGIDSDPLEDPIGDVPEASVSEEQIATGSCPSLSDDGRWLTYVEHRDGFSDPHRATLMDLTTGERVELERENATSCVEISGDGSTMVFSTVEGLVIIDRDTLARTTVSIPFVGWPSISDDGTRIAYQLCRGAVDTASCEPLPRVLDRRTGETSAIRGPSPAYAQPSDVRLAGGGESLTYEGTIAGGPGRMDTFVARLDEGLARPLGLSGGYHRYTGISDDGRVVVTQTDGEWAPGISGIVSERGLDVVWMADGVATHDLRATAGDMWEVRLMALSGDGGTIAFTTVGGLVEGDPSETSDVFRLRSGERTPERLVRCEASNRPALSDDGDTIVVSVGQCADGRFAVEPGLLLFRSI